MTFEEMEKSLGGLTAQMKLIENAQVVQGVLEHRIDQRIEALTAAAEATNRASHANHQALDKLLEIVASHEERLTGVESETATLRDGMTRMEAAMNALFEHMDRFIRGLESNGHGKS